MEATSLDEIYASVNHDAETIYVVPLIRYSLKKSDYLYLLYEELIRRDKYTIESISVFNHFKLVAGILKNRNAILHYHWLEFQDFKSLMGMPWKIACIYLFKKLGGNIVWTLHNEFPHDQKYLKLHQYLHKKMASWSDVLHVHCQTAVSKMSPRLVASEDKFKLVPHPEYPVHPIDKEEALHKLNTHFECELSKNTPLLLMFGNISRYKQIEYVADIVMSLESNCKLLIAGPVKKGNMKLYEELEAKQKISERISIIPSFIQEQHVSWFYSAADICVFNYREILSSGSYHMAQAHQRIIVAPNLGCLSEEHDKPNVHLFDNTDQLTFILNEQIKALNNG